MTPKKTIKVRCNKCKKEWQYGGKSKWYVTCPQCLNKVNITNARID